MITLRKEFRKRGINYMQMYKDAELVMYKAMVGHADDDGRLVYYEVFKRKVHVPDRFHDDAYEVYPSDESFGSWAWCCSNVECVKNALRKHFDDHPFSEFDSTTLKEILE